jgi:hypothetical protein
MKKFLLFAFICVVAVGCSQGGDATANAPATTENSPAVSANNSAPTTAPPSANEVTEAELEVPIYPGSVVDAKQEYKMASAQQSVRTTTDDPKKVADFYMAKVNGLKLEEHTSGDAINWLGEGKLPSGAKLGVYITKVAKDAPTEIKLVHEPAKSGS